MVRWMTLKRIRCRSYMSRYCNAVFLLAAGLWLAGAADARAQEPSVAGRITLFKGGAIATHQGASRNLVQGAAVYVGDKILTGSRTRIKLRMIDDAEITLGDDSVLVISAYRFDAGARQGEGTLGVLKGFFRAVTGALGTLQNRPFTVQTPVATIGIRGTDFWGEQHVDQLRVALIGGEAIIISNDAGSVEITQAGYGTQVTSPHRPPQKPFKWSEEALKRAVGTID